MFNRLWTWSIHIKSSYYKSQEAPSYYQPYLIQCVLQKLTSSFLSSVCIFMALRVTLSKSLFLIKRQRNSAELCFIMLEIEKKEQRQTQAGESSVLEHSKLAVLYVQKQNDHTDFISTKADHIWVGKWIIPVAWCSSIFSSLSHSVWSAERERLEKHCY